MSAEMPQSVYLLVLQWMAEVVSRDRFLHIARWQLGNMGYMYLHMSIAAWSPTRPAMYQLAVRLLLCSESRNYDRHISLGMRLDRQQRRALSPFLWLDSVDTVTVQVRQLARAHRVETAVLTQLLRLHPGLRGVVDRLRDAAEQVVAEDMSSSSESEDH